MNPDDPAFFERPSLADCRVAIVGLGLMGGSLALALRGRCRSLLGCDPDPAALTLARNCQAVEVISSDPGEILPQADLVILAAPVRAILKLLKELPNLHPGRAMVVDLGSTKRAVTQAMQALPQRFDVLGGHPMCGRERGTLAAADAHLFEGKTFAFTALAQTSPQARQLAGELAQAIGARPLWLDPETHDRWTAASSHLPYLVANALAAATPAEVAPMVGTGFLSTTRLAVSPVDMMLDVVLTNPEHVQAALRRFQGQLALLQSSLERGDEAGLRALLQAGAAQRERIAPS
jgi:prephenate dehydrogenase